MKAVILAGGFGSRLSEETDLRPKPMVEIGGKPILWHIMKIYGAYGVHDFIICLGYKGYMIKEYFANLFLHHSDVTIDLSNNTTEVHEKNVDPWRVTLVDTGLNTMTGGRLKRVADYLDDGDFFMTYGDGVADININELLAFHQKQGTQATLTAVRPPGRFGALSLVDDDTRVASFREKPLGDNAWINGGFFVLNKSVLELIEGDGTIWERDPMERLARDGELSAFQHKGFWWPMDTLRDKRFLDDVWSSGKSAWKVW